MTQLTNHLWQSMLFAVAAGPLLAMVQRVFQILCSFLTAPESRRQAGNVGAGEAEHWARGAHFFPFGPT
jgi:hypothetical protein